LLVIVVRRRELPGALPQLAYAPGLEFELNKRFARIAAVVAAPAIYMAGANAALPEGFAAAVTAYGADVAAGFGLLIAAGLVIFGAQKLGRKLGLL